MYPDIPYLPIILLSLTLLSSCEKESRNHSVDAPELQALYDESHKPFYHGVASGDPVPHGIILWTRVTPESDGVVSGTWEVSSDMGFQEIIERGSFLTGPERDYTVKQDIGGLQPSTLYYYRFQAMDAYSPIGKFKTLPIQMVGSLRLAVVSCTNIQWGYFNALSAIAAEDNIDYVIHLGDYIYEHAPGVYADTTLHRDHFPAKELLTLEDYRQRYAQYRLESPLRNAHQNHAFITIWDDHEIANNAYKEGAENHQEDDGNYAERRESARQAYFEWLPVRESGRREIYRDFKFGPLAQLIILDERLEGRTKQKKYRDSTLISDDTHTMLGDRQMAWLEEQLAGTRAEWKIIGSSVVFSEYVTVAGGRNMDSWDGYPADRDRILQCIGKKDLKNVIFLSGDTHTSLAFEVPQDLSEYKMASTAMAVEFSVPSVSSANKDEEKDSVRARADEEILRSAEWNPHLKFINQRDHGYLLITLTEKSAFAEFRYSKTVKEPSQDVFTGGKFVVKDGENRISPVQF